MTSTQGAEVTEEGETLAPIPRFGGRKRRAPPAADRAKVAKTGTSASASQSSSSPAVVSNSSSAVVNTSVNPPRTSPANVSQSCGVMAATSSQAVPTPSGGTGLSQGTTSISSAGNRISRAAEGSAPWRPVYRDLSGKLLTNSHHGRDNSPVAGLVAGNSILPNDAEFFEKLTSAYLALISAQSRYNVNAVDNTLSKRLLRYEDYISGICDSLGCTRADSIIEQLNKLKAEVMKNKDVFSRVAELESELEKTKSFSSKVADLQSSLDKAKAENIVAEASISKLRSDKDVAVKKLVEANLFLAKEKAAKEKVEGTLNKWRNDYNLSGRKMNAIFDLISPHLESCRPFRDEVRPFFEEFEPEDLENFDRETQALDEEATLQIPIIDKPLVTQTDDLVDISEAVRQDATYPNPDDPAGDN